MNVGVQTLFRLVLGATLLGSAGSAQTVPRAEASADGLISQPQEAAVSGSAAISGTITDTDGAAIPHAHVFLEHAGSKSVVEAETDLEGGFALPDLLNGRYNLKITATGFAPWKVEDLQLEPAQRLVLPAIALGVEALTATVNAITIEDLAEQQISAEEKQRILGVLPNFYVSYLPHAAPLTSRQKFKLAFKASTDPITFMTTGVTAGIEQAQGDLSGYGPGAAGYASRYGAAYGDRLSSTFLGAAVLPSLLHQDPRYFYRGAGSVLSRAMYAVSTVVICKGDNGRWQPNYSNIGGNLAAGGISAAYYPSNNRHSVQVTIDNTLIGTATGAFGTLFQEFLLRRFTHGIAPHPPGWLP